MFKKLLITAVLMTSIQSFAGQDGNGGFGIECNKKLYLLDLYEATHRYNYTIDLGAPNLSVPDKVEIMLGRLERLMPNVAKYYRAEARKLFTTINNGMAFLNNKKFVQDGKTLLDTENNQPLDIGLTLVCKNGRIIPIARNKYFTKNDLQIFLYEKEWKRLDNDNKAALILHELFYAKQQFTYTQRDSSQLRHLVALLSSNATENLNLPQFLEKTLYIFNKVEQNGNLITFSDGAFDDHVEFHPNGIIKSVKKSRNDRYRASIYNKYIPDISADMIFDEDGKINTVYRDWNYLNPIEINLKDGKTLSNILTLKYLYKNGVHQGFAVFGHKFIPLASKGFNDEDYFFNAVIDNQYSEIALQQIDLNGKLRCVRFGYNFSDINPNSNLKYFRIKLITEKNPRIFDSSKKVYVKFNENSLPEAIGCDPLQIDY